VRVGKNVSADLLAALRREGLDTVAGAMAYAGGQDLPKPNLAHRSRTRLLLADRSGRRHELYLKRYRRERWTVRLRRWVTYGRHTSPAGVEFDNIEALQAAGIPAGEAVICGEQWGSIDAEQSYLIVKAAPGRQLERCASDFLARNADKPEMLEAFTSALAGLVRKLHSAGYVHRDLYASHVFLDESAGRIRLHLIDLARVFTPRWRRRRWRVKDLAQLKYSPSLAKWTEGYWPRFLRDYLGCDGGIRVRLWSWLIDGKLALMKLRRAGRGRRNS